MLESRLVNTAKLELTEFGRFCHCIVGSTSSILIPISHLYEVANLNFDFYIDPGILTLGLTRIGSNFQLHRFSILHGLHVIGPGWVSFCNLRREFTPTNTARR